MTFPTFGRDQGALSAPGDPSPVVPGLTNLQAALFFGAASYNLLPASPWYHYVAGVFDSYGLPVGLQYTEVEGFLDFFAAMCPYEPNRFAADYAAMLCNEVDLPFDDHVAEIRVPVFYVGGAGGIGEVGVYATTLLGSTDVTHLVVRLHPPGEEVLDYGHLDILTGREAPALVWQPMLEWIATHSGRGAAPTVAHGN